MSEGEKKKHGFAAMSKERQAELAAMGGRAAHAKGAAHKFTAEEAQSAGRKGGAAVAQDREHMSKIGRLGGRRRSKKFNTSCIHGSPACSTCLSPDSDAKEST